VVFVADSQRLMLDANVDSLANLETNLAEIGFKITDLPVVIQYNKRDLPDVSAVAELQAALNQHGLPNFEACARSGQGVFETLTGIAKLTLASLRDRLTAGRTSSRPQAPPIVPRPQRKPALPAPPRQPLLSPAPAPVSTALPVSPARPPAAPLETGALRSMPAGGAAAAVATSVEAPPAANGHVQMSRDLALQIPRGALERARRVSLSLRFEDDQKNVVGDLQQGYDLEAHPSLKELLLRLQVSVTPRDDSGG
jgi:hypothetical protein